MLQGLKWLSIAGVLFFGVVCAVLTVFRYVDPPTSAFILWQRIAGGDVVRSWVPLDRISPRLVRSVVASEDARFCKHRGIDIREFQTALKRARRQKNFDIRGASTITMQVIKNMFLWPDRSLLRKGLELTIAPVMELLWPKRRILEIYLNFAEWGPGIFGIEAASRHHFRRSAASLTRAQAALLAAALPNPNLRRAGRPGPKTRRAARRVQARASRIDSNLSCLRKV
ncbi:MAG: monofunctional biosynthetic peptidoglycan transglycosylase [Hyphomicrobiaceae bacterium]